MSRGTLSTVLRARSTSSRLSLTWPILGSIGFGCGPELTPVAECPQQGLSKLLDIGADEYGTHVYRDARGWVSAITAAGGKGRTVAVECGVSATTVSDRSVEISSPQVEGLPWLGFVPGGDLMGAYEAFDPWQGEAELMPGQPVLVDEDAIVFGDPIFPGREPARLSRVEFVDRVATRVDTVDVRLPDSAERMGGWLTPGSGGISEAGLTVTTLQPSDDSEPRGVFAIDPSTGVATLLRPAAEHRVNVPYGSRFLPLHTTDAESEDRQDLVFDLETGAEIFVGELGSTGWQDAGVARVNLTDPDRTHLVLLPELTQLWLEGTWATYASMVADDGRRALFGPEGTYVLELGGDTPRLLDAARGRGRVVGEDVYVQDYGLSVEIPRGSSHVWGGPYRLVRVPLDGSASEEILAAPVYAALPLRDDRWAVIRSLDGDEGTGRLMLVDRRHGTEEALHEAVSQHFPRSNLTAQPYGRSADPSLAVDRPYDDFVFFATAEDSDRPALWRFAP